ncbi:prepilin peptidase [Roseibacterium beibuensis]|uniref:A24 family peptidase n=1 Tax=[Roseibacterium] beibuensis TaxID=1193142 RepID=UPI00217ED663|nr:prepilin peptidase [Roseibacterium beibuensis]MCS6627557.1 prepilin peptidase [Roseibacterium beibuensis]
MEVIQLLLLAVLPALVIVAGLKDLTSMKIPNWISGLLILGFFPAALLLGLGAAAIGIHVAVAVAALLVGMGLFAMNLLGGGDVKLMAAACLWLGLSGSGVFVLATAVIGGVFSLALLISRAWLRPYVDAGPGWLVQLMEPKGHIPYGVAIAAGALVAWPASPLMVAFLGG